MSNVISNYITVCGGIASGKTTFAECAKGIALIAVFEDFKINPFIQQFYFDQTFNAFETEFSFLLQHYNQIKCNLREKTPFICDFSLTLDLAYAQVTLTKGERKAFISVYNEAVRQVSFPKTLIYLQCPPEILLERIRNRRRGFENSISIDYLRSLDEALSIEVSKIADKTQVIYIDTARYNFKSNESDIRYIKSLLQKEFPS